MNRAFLHLESGRGGIRRSLLYALAGVSVVVAVTLGAGYLHYKSVSERPVLESGASASVTIPEKTAWPGVVDRLVESGLIKHRWYFEIWARRRGLPREAKAGELTLTGPMDWADLAEVLRKGGQAEGVQITIPEGWTMFHVAQRLESKGLVAASEFLDAARSSKLLNALALPGESVEGYLFPDTYRFDREATASEIIRRMVGRWREVWRKVAASHQGKLDSIKQTYEFDRHELVTLASLVEAETPVVEERPIIARVFLNRLDAGMRLQTDPTCVYGPETYLKTPTPELCNDPSNRYSTYAHDGLPPGPIGNPSRQSLEAAVDPSDSSEAKQYLYFVARQDGSGRHVFSRTYREHRRAVQKHLK